MTTATAKHEATSARSDPDQLTSVFIEAVPDMDEAKQQLARTLYQLLALGKPVTFTEIAKILSRSTEEVVEALNNWPGVFFNDDNEVIGFWGIAVQPMGHRMEIDGITSYAWCAWDSLFIPEMVGTAAQVTSKCEQTGETIQLTVSPDSVLANDFDNVVVSFVTPTVKELQANATASFCHFVYFFKDRQAGETWLENHKEAFLLTLDEAFAVGKKLNAERYNLVLD